MSMDREPPRLRTMAVPRTLRRALQTSPDEAPTSAELEAVLHAVNRTLRTAPANGESEEQPASKRLTSSPARAPRRPVSSAVLAATLAFALGAAAGVTVAGGIHLFTPPAVPPTKASRPRTPNADGSEVALPKLAVSSPMPTPAPSAAMAPSTSVRQPQRSEPADELALLARARRLTSSDPQAALALAAEHTEKFPAGMLAQEREVIAIDALLQSGRTSEAEARAASFRRRYPASPHGRRIDVLIGRTAP